MFTDLSPAKCQFSSPTERALDLLNRGQYEAALRYFQQVPQAVQDVDDLVNQAVCLLHLEQAEAALQICDRALALSLHHPQAWLFKGVALHRLGRHSEAYTCYNQALGKQAATTDHQSSLADYCRRRLQPLKSLAKHLKAGTLLRLWVN